MNRFYALGLIRLHRYALDARRQDRTWRYYAYSLAAALSATVLMLITLSLAWLCVRAGLWPLAVLVVALFVVPITHPLAVRYVLAPLGAVRTAYWTGHLATIGDSDAYGMCCAAWAYARKPSPAGEAWLAAKRDLRIPLGDAEVVTTALLLAGRGDAAAARRLMRSADELVEVHPAVRELAGEWLACDAAERGAWAELAADAAAARWPASALTYLLEGVAARRVGAAGAPGLVELRARWLLAPRRPATYALLADPPRTAAPPVADDAAAASTAPGAPDEPALARAVAAHVQLAAAPTTAASLGAVVAAWDRALADDATKLWLARRALELGAAADAADRALREVTAAVTDELGRRADEASLGAPDARGPVGGALARRLRHGRLDVLEGAFARWADRRHDSRALAPIDEWREWVALRASYDAVVAAGGHDLRRLAFPKAYEHATDMAVHLWNTRKEHAMAHAIFAWLKSEAMAVGDSQAIDTCTRNCRLEVPVRAGTAKRKA